MWPQVSAVELRREESRRALEDLVGPAQLEVLTLELAEACPLVGGETGRRAVVDLELLDPRAQVSGWKPIFAATDLVDCHLDPCSSMPSRTSLTARSRISWGTLLIRAMAPSFHGLEPPDYPSRFKPPVRLIPCI